MATISEKEITSEILNPDFDDDVGIERPPIPEFNNNLVFKLLNTEAMGIVATMKVFPVEISFYLNNDNATDLAYYLSKHIDRKLANIIVGKLVTVAERLSSNETEPPQEPFSSEFQAAFARYAKQIHSFISLRVIHPLPPYIYNEISLVHAFPNDLEHEYLRRLTFAGVAITELREQVNNQVRELIRQLNLMGDNISNQNTLSIDDAQQIQNKITSDLPSEIDKVTRYLEGLKSEIHNALDLQNDRNHHVNRTSVENIESWDTRRNSLLGSTKIETKQREISSKLFLLKYIQKQISNITIGNLGTAGDITQQINELRIAQFSINTDAIILPVEN